MLLATVQDFKMRGNARTIFSNTDYDFVSIIIIKSDGGTKNTIVPMGGDDFIVGSEGDQFDYAWRLGDAGVTPAELQVYGATGNYGDNVAFGDPPGRVPD